MNRVLIRWFTLPFATFGTLVGIAMHAQGGTPVATDADAPWVDREAEHSSLKTLFPSHYRVMAYNADGQASVPSEAR